MTARVQLKKVSCRESRGAWRQDELIGGKVNVTLTFVLTVFKELETLFSLIGFIGTAFTESHENVDHIFLLTGP
jgi:hypothetical protein